MKAHHYLQVLFFLTTVTSANAGFFWEKRPAECVEVLSKSEPSGWLKRTFASVLPASLLLKDPSIADFIRSSTDHVPSNAVPLKPGHHWYLWPRLQTPTASTQDEELAFAWKLAPRTNVVVKSKSGLEFSGQILQLQPTILNAFYNEGVYTVRLNWAEVEFVAYEPRGGTPAYKIADLRPWTFDIRKAEKLFSFEARSLQNPYRASRSNVPGLEELPLGQTATFQISNSILVPGILVRHEPPTLAIRNIEDGDNYFVEFNPNAILKAASSVRLHSELMRLRPGGKILLLSKTPTAIRLVSFLDDGGIVYNDLANRTPPFSEPLLYLLPGAIVPETPMVKWKFPPYHLDSYRELVAKHFDHSLNESIEYEEILEQQGPRFQINAFLHRATAFGQEGDSVGLSYSDIRGSPSDVLSLLPKIRALYRQSPARKWLAVSIKLLLTKRAQHSSIKKDEYFLSVSLHWSHYEGDPELLKKIRDLPLLRELKAVISEHRGPKQQIPPF